jgi:hypothetical protein
MDDIHDLLDHTDEQLALVEQLYRRSLEAKEQGKRLKRHQSWQPDHDWLKWLAGLSVESKHRILTPLENAEGRVTTYRLPNGETIEVQTEKGARFINTTTGEVGDADLFFGEPLTEDSYSDWMFAEPRLPALGVLQTIQTGVRVVVADVGQVAGL